MDLEPTMPHKHFSILVSDAIVSDGFRQYRSQGFLFISYQIDNYQSWERGRHSHKTPLTELIPSFLKGELRAKFYPNFFFIY